MRKIRWPNDLGFDILDDNRLVGEVCDSADPDTLFVSLLDADGLRTHIMAWPKRAGPFDNPLPPLAKLVELVGVPGNSVELHAEAPLPANLRLMDR